MTIELSAHTSNARVVYDLLNSLETGNLHAAQACMATDGVINQGGSLPWGGEWRGPEGLAAMVLRVSEFCKVRMNLTVTEAGAFVVVHGVCRFTSRQHKESLDMAVVECHTLRNGQVVHADVFYKDTQAISRLVGVAD